MPDQSLGVWYNMWPVFVALSFIGFFTQGMCMESISVHVGAPPTPQGIYIFTKIPQDKHYRRTAATLVPSPWSSTRFFNQLLYIH